MADPVLAALEALQTGRVAEAAALCERELQPRQDDANALHVMGLVYKRQGKLTQALGCFERILQRYPQAEFLPTVRSNYANALKVAGRVYDALQQYQLALQQTPDCAGLLNNLGNAYKDLGHWQEAQAAYDRALALEPENADALNNRGGAACFAGRYREAVALFRQALRIDPRHAQAWYNLGNTLQDLGEFSEALHCLQQAVELDPEHIEALACWVRLKEQSCQWEGLAKLQQRMQQRVCEQQDGRVYPFAFLSVAQSNQEQYLCGRDWARVQYAPLLKAPGWTPFHHPLRVKPRLRIGYLSSDLHGHATGILMAEVFELHRREQVEIVAYSAGPNDGSPLRRRLEQAFDAFHEIGTLSPLALATRIHADEIDILVDLKGYTRDTRTAALAFRPAPVQVAYLGFPATLGTDFVDYVLTDRFVTPLDQAPWFSEKFAYLPECYQCNDRHREIATSHSRSHYGVPESALVLCCFNHAYKITPEVWAIWCRILHALPEGVLWLLASTPMTEDHLRRAAVAQGIDPQRLIFAQVLPLAEHLARLRVADLMLDTLPVNAHTTASDALWTGLPLVTCAGQTFVSRVAGSLLQAVGLSECITHSWDEYIDLVCALGRDAPRRQALRAQLEHPQNLPLFNTPRFIRALESLYQAMWQRRLQGLPPESMLAQLAD